MKSKIFFKIIVCIYVSISLFSCSKEEVIPQDVEINNFVWGGMNAYYKWQGEVENLADTKFSTRDQLNEFLTDFETPDVLFNDLVYTAADDESIITDDFTVIEDAFDGIKTTTGMKVNLMPYVNGNGFYLYVYDVIAGSDAAQQGVTRGMVVTHINGTQISLTNGNGLFTNNSIAISLGNYNTGNPVSNGNVINLVRTVVQENPIANVKLFNTIDKKIGYLQYNNFTPFYDGELNTVFESFRSEMLDALIIDLRYNEGGSIETATYLASMITGQFKNETFSKGIWNDKVMRNVLNENLTHQFTDEIDNGVINESINSLGLTKVYFIVSDGTAGPSEVLINGLEEYIDVQLIGTQTKGLTEASMTLYDSDDYTKTGENFITSHTWAIQAVVLESQNSNNTNEAAGHIVDVEIQENVSDLGVLGEISDPILSSTLSYIQDDDMLIINGVINPVTTQNLWNSTMRFIDYNKMYVRLK